MTTDRLGLIQGVKSVPAALGILRHSPKILLWLVPPLAITLLLDALAFFFAFSWMREGIVGILPQHGYGSWAATAISVFAAIAVVLLLGWTFAWLFLTLASPFQDYISAAVERERKGDISPDPTGFGGFFKSFARSALQAVILLAVTIPILVLGFIPIIGPVIVFAWSAFAMGFSFVTIPAGRIAGRLRDRFAFARRHRGALFGLGAVISVATLIPLMSLLCMPLFVVAGTLLYLEAAEDERSRERHSGEAG